MTSPIQVSWLQILENKLPASKLENISLMGLMGRVFADGAGLFRFGLEPLIVPSISEYPLIIVNLFYEDETQRGMLFPACLQDNRRILNVYGRFDYQESPKVIGTIEAKRIKVLH